MILNISNIFIVVTSSAGIQQCSWLKSDGITNVNAFPWRCHVQLIACWPKCSSFKWEYIWVFSSVMIS